MAARFRYAFAAPAVEGLGEGVEVAGTAYVPLDAAVAAAGLQAWTFDDRLILLFREAPAA